MNIGIFGIGAIGSIIIKHLRKDLDYKYYYLNRSTRDVILIEYKGRITKINLELSNHIAVQLDWLIVCLKEYHYQDATEKLKSIISPTTKIAIFQNGINLSKHISYFSNPNNILETIIDCPCQLIEKQSYLQLRQPNVILPVHPLSELFRSLFTEEMNVTILQDFVASQWEKLIESSSLGAMQVLHMTPCSLFKHEKNIEEYLLLIEEGVKVAHSHGVQLDHDLKDKLRKKLLTYPATKSSSMLLDKLAGKQLELEAKIGAIVKLADKNKIKIPTTLRIYHSILL